MKRENARTGKTFQKKQNKQKIILTIIESHQQFKTVGGMMKKKEQLLKMGVRSKARITTP